MLETRLVPASANEVVTIANADGRLEAFRISSVDHYVSHDWQQYDQNGNLVWSGWQTLGSPSSYDLQFLVASRNADGTLEVFVTDNPTVGTDEVYRINQSTPGGIWTAWTNMGGVGTNTIISMDVGQNVQDGRLEIFVLRKDAHVVHKWQVAPQGDWSDGWADMGTPPTQLGGAVKKIVVAQNAVGDPNIQGLDVFALCEGSQPGTGTFVTESRQSGGSWSSWSLMPNTGLPSPCTINDIAVGQNQNNYLQVFVSVSPYPGNGSRAVFTVQQASLGGLWTTWTSLGSPNPSQQLTLHVARNQTSDPNSFYNGTLEVVASDGTSLYQIAQPGANNDKWTGAIWGSLGAPSGVAVALFAIGQNKDGRLEVFVITSDTTVYHIWQGSPAGSWSSWNQL